MDPGSKLGCVILGSLNPKSCTRYRENQGTGMACKAYGSLGLGLVAWGERWLRGLGCLGFGVLRVQGLGFRVQGFGFRVLGEQFGAKGGGSSLGLRASTRHNMVTTLH